MSTTYVYYLSYTSFVYYLMSTTYVYYVCRPTSYYAFRRVSKLKMSTWTILLKAKV